MRKRAVRELGTILGVVIIILALVFLNSQWNRMGLKERMIAQREATEKSRTDAGLKLLDWPTIQKTVGTFRSGPTFDEQIKALKDQSVSLIGFMVPLYEFRETSEFLLLPMPIECYFCQSPPMRDVFLVKMAQDKKARLVNEPVLVSGNLILNEGEKVDFFYEIHDAAWEAGQSGAKLTQKQVAPEHRAPKHMSEGPLVDGTEPPKPGANSEPAGAPAPAPAVDGAAAPQGSGS